MYLLIFVRVLLYICKVISKIKGVSDTCTVTISLSVCVTYWPSGELLDRSYLPISRNRPCLARQRILACSFSSAREFSTTSTPEKRQNNTHTCFFTKLKNTVKLLFVRGGFHFRNPTETICWHWYVDYNSLIQKEVSDLCPVCGAGCAVQKRCLWS